jgi:hypothetical protein
VGFKAVDDGPFISEIGYRSCGLGDVYGAIDAGGREPLELFAAIAEHSAWDKKASVVKLVSRKPGWLKGAWIGGRMAA